MFEDFISSLDDCRDFVIESFNWLEGEYVKNGGTPKAKLIYFLAKQCFSDGTEIIDDSIKNSKQFEEQWLAEAGQWFAEQGDDPVALCWLGRFYEQQSKMIIDSIGSNGPLDEFKKALSNSENAFNKAIEMYTKSITMDFFPACIFLGNLYGNEICYRKLKDKGLQNGCEALLAKQITNECLGKARVCFLKASESQDITTRYHAYKSLMVLCSPPVRERPYYYEGRNLNKAAYWCIKMLDIIPDCFVSRLCLNDLLSKNQDILRTYIFPKALISYKPNGDQRAVNDAIHFENKLEQGWLEAFEHLKSISIKMSFEDAQNVYKIVSNEEVKDREYYEKSSFILEKAIHYLPLALEKNGFTFMVPKGAINSDFSIRKHLSDNFSTYDSMNPSPSDELTLRLYTMGDGVVTLAFGNENVQLCDKVMDLLEGPDSLLSLINDYQKEIQRLRSQADTDSGKIAEHTKNIESLKNIIKSFKEMLLAVQPAKIEQFKQTYGFLAYMFD